MTVKVNGEGTTPGNNNETFGTDGRDKISGDSGKNTLSGLGGVDALYGGAGNDTFIIRLSDFVATKDGGPKVQDYIYDFGGAGGWSSSNNDFLALTGFGAGSTITKSGNANNPDGSVNAQTQYYTIHSTTTGEDYTIFIKSLNSKELVKGDFNFYG